MMRILKTQIPMSTYNLKDNNSKTENIFLLNYPAKTCIL